MAAKKTANKKKQTRVIDMTEDKTSPYVADLVRNVTKEYRNVLKKSNIVAFDQIYLQKDIAQYFLNRKLYTTFFNQNTLSIFDYAMKTAVSKVVSNIVNNMLTVDGGIIPGYWEIETLVLAMTHIAIVPETNDPNKWYLSIKLGASTISEGEIAEQMERGEVPDAMEFSQYNPNRLVQMMYRLIRMIYNAILSEVKNRYPTAKLSGTGTEDDPVATVRYTKELAAIMKQDTPEENAYDFANCKSLEPYDKNVTRFIEATEHGLIVYCATLMITGGISNDLVKDFLSRAKLHAIFNNSEATDLGHCTVTYIIGITDASVSKTSDPIQASFEYTISDMADILTDSMSIGRRKVFGAKLKNLMQTLVTDAMTVAIIDYETSKLSDNTDEVSDIV